MADNLNIRKPQDPTKINIHQDWELTHWSKHFGVTEAKIKEAVKAVGVLVADVKRYLGK